MFSSMFKSLDSISNKKRPEEDNILKSKTDGIAVHNVDNVIALLNEIQEESDDDSTNSEMSLAGVRNGLENFSIGHDNVGNFEKSKNNFIGENKRIQVEDPEKKIFQQIELLQCLFTWKLKSQKDQDIITRIKNKYGDTNLDMSLPEFTFVRFIGNLIISYELNQNGKSDASNTKMLEIGSWLEKLDKGTDEFYLSINVGLKHIRMANFVHKQFADHETGGLKWLFNEIVPFENMDTKSKAAVYAVRAVILIEYGENLNYFKNACKYAYKACELDPDTSHWFHIYSLVLIAQRQFIHSQALNKTKNQLLYTNDDCPMEKNINLAIQRAIIYSEQKCTYSVDSFLLTTLTQYLADEIQLTLNGLQFLKTSNPKYIVDKNKTSNLDEDMKDIVEKHYNGENALPYLMVLISKYDEQDKWKILAQICSYTILYTNNFRTGVEQFLMLIEDMESSSRHLVTNHNSLFIVGSTKFNLAELIFNEIRLVTKQLSASAFKDILFYYKMFFKIKDTCGLKMKIIDPAMRIKLIGQSSNWFLCSNTTHQYKTNSLCNKNYLSPKSTYTKKMYQNEIDVSDNEIKFTDNKDSERIVSKPKTENLKSRGIHLQNVGSKVTIEKSKSNNRARYKKEKSLIKSSTKFSLSKTYQMYSKNFQSANNISSRIEFCDEHNSVLSENYKHFQKQTDILNICKAINQTTNSIKTNVASNQLCVDMSLANLPRILTSQAIYKAFLKNILRNYPNSFRIYTDASRIQNCVGIAIVSSKDTFSYKLASDYTSSDAEAVAILRALDYALTENYHDFVILSDSLSTISCIHNQNTSSDVIKSILCLLHAHQLKGNKMGFIWIPSHNAIEGNEKADKLAKQIAMSTTTLTYSHNSFIEMNIKYKSL